METIRNVWGPAYGRHIVDLSWSPIQADSVVLVTASEYHRPPGSTDGYRFAASASIRVCNVSPRNGGVMVVIEIDWPEPLLFTTDVTLLADHPDVMRN